MVFFLGCWCRNHLQAFPEVMASEGGKPVKQLQGPSIFGRGIKEGNGKFFFSSLPVLELYVPQRECRGLSSPHVNWNSQLGLTAEQVIHET